MKSKFLTVAAAALLVIPTLRAEDKPPGDKPPGDKPPGERPGRGPGGPGGAGGRFSPEERLKRMTEELSLTPDQVTKIKAIFDKNAEAMKALRDKGRDNLTEEDKTKMRESFKAQQEEIANVLTPEQKKKQEETRQRGGGPGGRRGPGGPGGPGGDKPPGPPPEKPADK